MRSKLSASIVIFSCLSASVPAARAQEGITRANDIINRAEAITAAIRSKEQLAPQVVWFSSHLPEIPLFPDIDQASWYAPFVEVGFLEGIIRGFGDGTFRPSEGMLTRHALELIKRISGKKIDVPFSKDKPITRGQFFAILDAVNTGKSSVSLTERGKNANPSVSYEELFGKLPSLPPMADNKPLVLTIKPSTVRSGTKSKREFASSKPFAITIPNLEINDITISHPEDPFSQKGILKPLKSGLGHLFSYPGDPGKVMVYGHSSGYPWDISEFTRIFRKINRLKSGDRIYITYDRRLYVYEVNRKEIVDAKDVSPFNDNGTSELILYTCWPPDSIEERYLVYAFPVEIVALKP